MLVTLNVALVFLTIAMWSFSDNGLFFLRSREHPDTLIAHDGTAWFDLDEKPGSLILASVVIQPGDLSSPEPESKITLSGLGYQDAAWLQAGDRICVDELHVFPFITYKEPN